MTGSGPTPFKPSMSGIARLAVAILIVVEAGVLLGRGATWPVPYPVMAVIVAGLLIPGIRGAMRWLVFVIAAIYAVLFIAPGGILIGIGVCGSPVNSSCTNAEFSEAATLFGAAAIVNITAAVLLWPRAPGSPQT